LSDLSAAPRATSPRIKPETLSIAGIETGVLRLGDAGPPPVLLLHGFCGDMMTWQFNLAALARRQPVVAIDLPGHGRSGSAAGCAGWSGSLDWLEAAMRVLGLNGAHLVGHSLGGRLLLALIEAGRIEARSLTLIACAGISPRYDHGFLEQMTRIATRDDAEACARRLFGGAAINTDIFARGLFARLSQAPARAGMADFLDRTVPDARQLDASPIDWPKVACALQFIWGRDDPVIELPPADWLPASAESHVLDAVGHMPHVAASDTVNRLIEDIIAGTQPQVSKVAAQE
jgi:pimeloyl-ACP methyl ester carboxylesterase